MKLRIEEKTYTTVELTEQQQDVVMLKRLSDYFDLLQPSSTRYAIFIKEGNVVERREERGGSHSWDEQDIKRPATEEDELAYKFKKLLENKMKSIARREDDEFGS